MPYEDNQFDVVMCIGTLEHLRKEDVSKALHECVRIAKKYFVFYCPEKRAAAKPPWFKPVEHLIDNPHLTIEPVEWWEQQVRQVLKDNNIPHKKVAPATQKKYHVRKWLPVVVF